MRGLPDVITLAGAAAAASTRYHRLLLLVGSDRAGRGALLGTFAANTGSPLINVSMALSEALLPLPRVDRVAEVGILMDRLVSESGSQVVCLDNIEVLFVPDLRVDVLGRLQQLARNHTLIVNWPGAWSTGALTYADASHPEFFQSRADAASVFTVAAAGLSPA
jgi:fluoride ion exporter CrcB/FEX